MVFNGRDGWVTATQAERPFPVELMSGQELDGTRLEAELAFPTRIKQALTGMRVGLPVSNGDRDANVIQGRTAAGTLVSLYFDTQTGLLLRQVRFVDTAVGVIPTQVDYSDYRDVAGVKVPFKRVVTWTDGRSTILLNQVQANAGVEAARFNKPSPPRAKSAIN